MPETYSETKLQFRYKNNTIATAIEKAISPDNIGVPDGIEILTCIEKNNLNIKIISKRKLGSLVSTLDDLLSCIQAAEKTLENIQ